MTGLRGYHDLSRYPEGERIPGIVIVRFDAPLFFANGGIFDDFVRSRVKAAGPGIRTVILAAEPITDIDTTAIDELVELDDWLASRGIRLVLAEMKDPVVDVLRDYGLLRAVHARPVRADRGRRRRRHHRATARRPGRHEVGGRR